MKSLPLLALLVFSVASAAPAAVTVLKNGSALDGGTFYGAVTLSRGLLYGITGGGGASGAGTFFSLSPSGAGFNASFDFATPTGGTPVGTPIEGSDGRFYGATVTGGATNHGVIYAVNRDGTGYTVLRNLTSATDGENPFGRLLQGQDGKLYGVTSNGGGSSGGTIFRIRKDGTGFGVLRALTTATDGGSPYAGLVQAADGTLYGATTTGGPGAGGTIFKVQPDGTGFTVLKALTSGTDGASVVGPLVLSGDGFLYGTGATGGTLNGGVVFRINRDGSGYTKIYEFSTALPASNNGYIPYPGLAEGVDGRLYGSTSIGGTANLGTVFSIAKNGTGFQLLHTFTGVAGAGPGSTPSLNTLTPAGPGVFIGTTPAGGANNLGVIYKLTVPVAKPVVTVTARPAKATTLATFTFRGKATGPGSVTRVEYRVDAGPYKPAAGKGAWSFKLALKKGKSTVSIRAKDSLGQISAIRKVTFTRK